MKRGRLAGVVIGLLAVVGVARLAAAAVASQQAGATPSSAALPDQATAHSVMGAISAGFSIRVSALQRDAAVPGAPALAAGQHDVTLQVTFENQSQTQQRANVQDFRLKDPAGLEQLPIFTADPVRRHWQKTDLYPAGNSAQPQRDADAQRAGSTFGPVPLCFQHASDPNGRLLLEWDPDVSMPFFSTPAEIVLQ